MSLKMTAMSTSSSHYATVAATSTRMSLSARAPTVRCLAALPRRNRAGLATSRTFRVLTCASGQESNNIPEQPEGQALAGTTAVTTAAFSMTTMLLRDTTSTTTTTTASLNMNFQVSPYVCCLCRSPSSRHEPSAPRVCSWMAPGLLVGCQPPRATKGRRALPLE